MDSGQDTNARGKNYHSKLQYFVAMTIVPFLTFICHFEYLILESTMRLQILSQYAKMWFSLENHKQIFGCCENNKVELNSRVISRQPRKCY